mmetsp:Transcript_25738/g.57716  ORF Transcript_25738/g.57716 Transcript_25738/m.57716 type:complete len:237 (+) Transcript_25738:308-1018(+)
MWDLGLQEMQGMQTLQRRGLWRRLRPGPRPGLLKPRLRPVLRELGWRGMLRCRPRDALNPNPAPNLNSYSPLHLKPMPNLNLKNLKLKPLSMPRAQERVCAEPLGVWGWQRLRPGPSSRLEAPMKRPVKTRRRQAKKAGAGGDKAPPVPVPLRARAQAMTRPQRVVKARVGKAGAKEKASTNTGSMKSTSPDLRSRGRPQTPARPRGVKAKARGSEVTAFQAPRESEKSLSCRSAH